MSTHRLHVEKPLTSGTSLTLPAEQAHYLARVLRCRAGDAVTVFDGSGNEFPSHIESVSKNAVTLLTGNAVQARTESALDVRLVQCLSKGERMDLVVQKATELGVRRISVVHSEFSVVRLSGERGVKRREHWQRIAASACEQCGRVVPPLVDAPASLAILLEGAAPRGTTRLMLQPGEGGGFAGAGPAEKRIELLVGPEGGLSDAEREQAALAGFRAVSIGPRVLRTESAAIAGLVLAQYCWGDLGGE